MPRPGPRPYECVRRAWHSDRHQPMRGTVIQEILRVANEIHSSATKKNKEWQVKLPVVVFKAEEILYSKANSEEEYKDFGTLYDRVNDAINTIIRRDESTETGEFLQPCIEAALNLGCTVRRASRSQRHSNPRSYLNPSAQEPISAPPRILGNIANEGSSHLQPLQLGNRITSPQFISYYSTPMRPTTMRSTGLRSESSSPVTQDNNPSTPHEPPFCVENFPPSGSNQSCPMETGLSSNSGGVFPLYYGTPVQNRSFQIPQASNCNMAVDMPCIQSTVEPAKMGILKNLSDVPANGSNRTIEAECRDTFQKPPETQCDLSLQLGPISAVGGSAEHGWVQEVEYVDLSRSRGGSKFNDLSLPMGKELCFFPTENADDPLESCPSKRSSEGEGLNVEANLRKRKAPASNFAEDGQFGWPPNLPSNQFLARTKKPGL